METMNISRETAITTLRALLDGKLAEVRKRLEEKLDAIAKVQDRADDLQRQIDDKTRKLERLRKEIAEKREAADRIEELAKETESRVGEVEQAQTEVFLLLDRAATSEHSITSPYNPRNTPEGEAVFTRLEELRSKIEEAPALANRIYFHRG